MNNLLWEMMSFLSFYIVPMQHKIYHSIHNIPSISDVIKLFPLKRNEWDVLQS